MNFMKQLWWIGAVLSAVLIIIIRFTDWRLIPCDPYLGQNANIAMETLSFSYLAGAIFFLLNDYIPRLKKQDIYVRHVKRQVSIVKEYMRQIVNSIKPFEINKDYEDKAFIDAFVNTDLLSSFMGGKESIEEYIVTRKNKIETLCEQTLSLYGDYMDENELNYLDSVLNSYFIQNTLTPMKFDIPKDMQPSYPNNQKEIGESICQIFSMGKHVN